MHNDGVERSNKKGEKVLEKTMSAGQLRRMGMEIDATVPDRASVQVEVTIRATANPPKIYYDYKLTGPFQWTNEWPSDWPAGGQILKGTVSEERLHHQPGGPDLRDLPADSPEAV